MAATYNQLSKHITNDKLFIKRYCDTHPGATFIKTHHPEIKQLIGYQLTFSDYGFIFSINLKLIVQEIIKHDKNFLYTYLDEHGN